MEDFIVNNFYRITKKTKMIKPYFKLNYCSKIIDTDGEYISKAKPIDIIDLSCKEECASYDARKKGVNYLFNFRNKAPIPINPNKGIVFFPTKAHKDSDNVWVSYCQVKDWKIHDKDPEKTIIEFQDGTFEAVDVTASTFRKQYLQAAQIFAHFTKDSYI
ncbi:hypothetical protein CEY16_07515 [Halalkalibacillus sediminis]|uniref:Competence protein n=1 Tax=Halalkalibacillus sediminis TaxID=2018042 RepID=A0A2I0QUK7_9BACI|nr:competence protein ComK [Halalkalibacillus sediminis]PKR77770.1 hypothetical protein CEY16_07515 [Halalkalibacillus sediminis]